jgi:hypothetical protein
MRRTFARIVLVSLGLALTVLTNPLAGTAAPPAAVASATAVPAVVSAPLGGMTLNEYCIALGYQGAKVSDNGQSNPWVCYYGGGAYWTPLDLFGACRWQFRDLGAAGFSVTYVGNGNCSALNASAYGVGTDLNRIGDYCRSLGYQDAVVAYRNVGGWRCTSGGVLYALDLHAACRFTNASLVAQGYSLTSYFHDYGATFAITCVYLKHA